MKPQTLIKNRLKTNKSKHKVTNWPEYNKSLINRGNLTIWFDEEILKRWYENILETKKQGMQNKYSDDAILAMLTISKLFKLSLRNTVGFVKSIFSFMKIDLEVPDYSTLSRRMKKIDIKLKVYNKNFNTMIIDSTGIKLYGEGEWKVQKHGSSIHSRWKKIHLGIDETGQIQSLEVTDSLTTDGKVLPDLLNNINNSFSRFIGDGAYDSHAIYDLLKEKGVTDILIPPVKGARIKYPEKLFTEDAYARDVTINEVNKTSKDEWKKSSGYHKRSTVEVAMFRYKRIIGDKLVFRKTSSQYNEVILSCSILNKMLSLGKPISYKV